MIKFIKELLNIKPKKQICIHQKGEFQYWLAQGIKYYKCTKCGENYEPGI